MNHASNFTTRKRKPRWATLVIVGLAHVVILFGLARAFAPDFTDAVLREATSLVTVTVKTYEEPEAEPSLSPPQPDEGAAGDPGREATAREVTAPENPVPRRTAAPRAASTGNANQSGATEAGDGTGAGGAGDGTGSGRRGSGSGGAVAVGPSVRSGELNEARDFPVPEGGRQTRFGRSVTVHFTVTVDGRARDCTVARTGVDAETTARVCPLVMQKIRFNPATTADGTPIEARYGYRVDFRARS